MRSVVEQRLDRPQVGERRVHRHVDRLVVLRVSRYDSFCTTWMASRWLWCIFQLPLISGCGAQLRALRRLPAGRRDRAGRPARCSSSDAPPPVDTWSMRSARPNLASAAALSPPPTTVNPALGHRLGHGPRCPPANRGSSNTPIGPFHRTVPALSRMMSDELEPRSRARCRGPSTRAGCRRATDRTSSSGPRADEVGGNEQLVLGLALASSRLQASTWSGSTSESPTA